MRLELPAYPPDNSSVRNSGRILLKSLDRYLARQIAVPLFATITVAAMLLLLDRMGRLFDFVIREGGPVSVVWRMLANLLPEYLGLGVPLGLMLGILLAFRRLALSSELDAMRAAGIGYTRMLRVPYLFALGAAIVNFGIVGYLQPISRYFYEELRYDLRTGALGASIHVGEFNRLGKTTALRVEESRNSGQDLRGLFVRSESQTRGAVTVTAARGQFLGTNDPDTILLRLNDGVLVQDVPKYATPRVLSFAQHTIPIDLPRMEGFRRRGGKEIERTLPELVRVDADPQLSKAERAPSIASTQRRIIQVVIMAFLPLLAVALAVPPKRSSSAVGVFIGILVLVGYHKSSEYTERVGSAGQIDPFWGQWLPFLVFAGLCVWLYAILAYKAAGAPIGGLERGGAALSKAVAALFTRREPRTEPA